MNKLSVCAQWIAVAALAVVIGYMLVRPAPQPDYTPAAWHNWEGVTVLSYAGIARHETSVYPSVKRLESHLSALRDAGYRTVRPADVRAYLDERAPLPEKALLLIFEGGRKEAFIRATPVLQRTGFSAVIVVPTAVMTQWGGFYLKRGDIRRVSRLPQWQVGSMGHAAVQPPPGSLEPQRFLAHRAVNGGSRESDGDFRERLLQDYARSAEALEDAAGRPPLLYLYPFGEAGQHRGADPLAEAANREGVTRHFTLAFTGGFHAFNGPGSDPFTLTRLRVPGDWPAERLIAELAAGRPRTLPQEGLGTPSDWTLERAAEWRDGTLNIEDNAAAWLRGSDAWRDVEVSADLQPAPGTLASLYARHTGSRSWLRVAVDAEGLRVQERLGDRLYTLRRHASDGSGQAVRHLRLRLRNNRAWVWLDNQLVAENLPLAPATRSGRVGLGSADGLTAVSSFTARPLPARWLLANSVRLLPDRLRPEIQAVVPNWFKAGEPPAITETARQDLLNSAVSGIRTIPLLTGAATLDATNAHAWAVAVDAAVTAADLKPLLPMLAVDGPHEILAAALRDLHYRVTHLLTPAEALERGRSLAQTNPDEFLVINAADSSAASAALELSRTIPSGRLALREPDGQLDLKLPSAIMYQPAAR